MLLVPFLHWPCYLSNRIVSQFRELNQQKTYSLFLARLVFCQFNSPNSLSKGIRQASAPAQRRGQEHTGRGGQTQADLNCHRTAYPTADPHHGVVRTDSNLCLYNRRPPPPMRGHKRVGTETSWAKFNLGTSSHNHTHKQENPSPLILGSAIKH